MQTLFTKLFTEFLESEQASGVVLILCTLISIIIANTMFGHVLTGLWHTKIGFEGGRDFAQPQY